MPVDDPGWYEELIDAATERMAHRRGLDPARLVSSVVNAFELRTQIAAWPDEFFEDPHCLGWMHETYGERAREASFRRHIQEGGRHEGMTSTTQLYTPRWVADALVRSCLDVVQGREEAVILDPAVGGGQMLLAALDVLGESEEVERVVGRLRGVDLDERAVRICRRGLALAVGVRSGEIRGSVLEVLERQIVVGDGLSAGMEGAEIVVTNPPYMGWRSMPKSLRDRLQARFRPFHHDLATAFILRCEQLSTGAMGILSQQGIWYLRRFEKARRALLQSGRVRDFLHLGVGVFPGLSGEKASVVGFVYLKTKDPGPTRVWDLRSMLGEEKRERFEEPPREIDFDEFLKVPGSPIAHDLPASLRRLFEQERCLGDVVEIPTQNKTGNNRRYVKSFREVEQREIRRCEAVFDGGEPEGRWVFYSKGGKFAPWWGNWDYLVDWSAEARLFYDANRTSNLVDERFWFREGVVYTDFGGRRFSARWMPPGCLFDMTGPAIFARKELAPECNERERIGFLLGLLNSSVARRLLRALNPTLHFQVRDVRALPLPSVASDEVRAISEMVWGLVEAVRDWHAEVRGDPREGALGVENGLADPLSLVAWEARIDARICELYEVDVDPVKNASVAEHHRLARLWSEESRK